MRNRLKLFATEGETECSLGEIMAQQSRGFTRPLKGKTGTIRWENKDVKDPGRDHGLFWPIRIHPFFLPDPKVFQWIRILFVSILFFCKGQVFFIKLICKNKISSEIFLLLLFYIIFYSRLNRERKKGKNWDRFQWSATQTIESFSQG